MQVRIHGTTDHEKLKKATIRFLKAVQKHEKEKEHGERHSDRRTG